VDYIGSITLDEDLIDAAGLVEGEKVQVLNVNNGNRLETYVIKGSAAAGTMCLNGPAACGLSRRGCRDRGGLRAHDPGGGPRVPPGHHLPGRAHQHAQGVNAAVWSRF
jgi:hypothetical protein